MKYCFSIDVDDTSRIQYETYVRAGNLLNVSFLPRSVVKSGI